MTIVRRWSMVGSVLAAVGATMFICYFFIPTNPFWSSILFHGGLVIGMDGFAILLMSAAKSPIQSGNEGAQSGRSKDRELPPVPEWWGYGIVILTTMLSYLFIILFLSFLGQGPFPPLLPPALPRASL